MIKLDGFKKYIVTKDFTVRMMEGHVRGVDIQPKTYEEKLVQHFFNTANFKVGQEIYLDKLGDLAVSLTSIYDSKNTRISFYFDEGENILDILSTELEHTTYAEEYISLIK